MNQIDLAARTALVTGGSKGIGQAIAGALYGAGARVAIVARGDQVLVALRESLPAVRWSRRSAWVPQSSASASARPGRGDFGAGIGS